MNIRVVCPDGHPLDVDASKLGQTLTCPRCARSFSARLPDQLILRARKEDKDEDDDEVGIREGEPQRKVGPKKANKSADDDDAKPQKKAVVRKAPDEDEEDDRPRKKKRPRDDDEVDDNKQRRTRDDEDDEDDKEEPEQDTGHPDEEEEPIIWTRKKRQLKIVNIGMTAFIVSVYMMLVMFLLWALMSVVLAIALAIAYFSDDKTFSAIMMTAILVMLGIMFLPIYVCHMIGWITGLFAPPKSGGRPVAITAICLFLSPSLLYAVWLLFHFGIIDRQDVSMNMLNMAHGSTFLLANAAFYCSLIYIGRIGAFMRVADDRKPQALGWLIVGGTVILVAVMVALTFLFVVLGIIVVKLVVWGTSYPFFLIITSLKELLEVENRTRTAIVKFIKDQK